VFLFDGQSPFSPIDSFPIILGTLKEMKDAGMTIDCNSVLAQRIKFCKYVHEVSNFLYKVKNLKIEFRFEKVYVSM